MIYKDSRQHFGSPGRARLDPDLIKKWRGPPDSVRPSETHYIGGSPDGSRTARVVVATSNCAERRLFRDEMLAFHEGIPGHHLQISLQERLKDLPEFRQFHVISTDYDMVLSIDDKMSEYVGERTY